MSQNDLGDTSAPPSKRTRIDPANGHPDNDAQASVAFLGPLGTYSHQATNDFFGQDIKLVPCERIADVFASVAQGKARYGLVPIDNSSFGPVLETAEALRDTRLSTRGMIALKVGHALLGKKMSDTSSSRSLEDQESNSPPRPRTVKRIYSHVQGIGQCLKYLDERYPDAERVPVNSTAKAATEAAKDDQGLAICSLKCAEVYGLEVVDRDIQDVGFSNTTRFIVLSTSDQDLPARYPVAKGPSAEANGQDGLS